MLLHRRRRATQHPAAIPLRPSGYERRGAICGVAAPRRWRHIAVVAAITRIVSQERDRAPDAVGLTAAR